MLCCAKEPVAAREKRKSWSKVNEISRHRLWHSGTFSVGAGERGEGARRQSGTTVIDAKRQRFAASCAARQSEGGVVIFARQHVGVGRNAPVA
jgi:hypothetical protein